MLFNNIFIVKSQRRLQMCTINNYNMLHKNQLELYLLFQYLPLRHIHNIPQYKYVKNNHILSFLYYIYIFILCAEYERRIN